MKRAVLQPDDIARQVKRADLGATIGEKLIAANGPLPDLINVFSGLFLRRFPALCCKYMRSS